MVKSTTTKTVVICPQSTLVAGMASLLSKRPPNETARRDECKELRPQIAGSVKFECKY
jgi:hypothetical protein